MMGNTVEIESVHTADALMLIEQLTRELAPRYPDSKAGSAGFRPTDMDVPGAFYKKTGFAKCDCWGEYVSSGWSVCYRKELL